MCQKYLNNGSFHTRTNHSNGTKNKKKSAKLKEMISHDITQKYFKVGEQLKIETDASYICVEYALFQNERPVAYASKTPSKTTKLCTNRKEDAGSKKITNYDPEPKQIKYKERQEVIIEDALVRAPEDIINEEKYIDIYEIAEDHHKRTSQSESHIRKYRRSNSGTKQDDIPKQIIEYIKNGWPKKKMEINGWRWYNSERMDNFSTSKIATRDVRKIALGTFRNRKYYQNSQNIKSNKK
ncbi:hypothetical protein JTB14_005795 [Gonioctena quinquepunctata]|nr:hypothetical protein JTB14_005795 [Gonioctena quinquepunctata]